MHTLHQTLEFNYFHLVLCLFFYPGRLQNQDTLKCSEATFLKPVGQLPVIVYHKNEDSRIAVPARIMPSVSKFFVTLGSPARFSSWAPLAKWSVGCLSNPGFWAWTPRVIYTLCPYSCYLGMCLCCCQHSHLRLPAINQQSEAISSNLSEHTSETTQQTQIYQMTDLFPSSHRREKHHTYLPRTLKGLPVYTRSCKLTGAIPSSGPATYPSGSPSLKHGLACSAAARWQATSFLLSSVMKAQKSLTLSSFHQQSGTKGLHRGDV